MNKLKNSKKWEVSKWLQLLPSSFFLKKSKKKQRFYASVKTGKSCLEKLLQTSFRPKKSL